MRRVAVLLSTLLLVACGDGGSGGSATPTGEPPGTAITADLTVPPGTVLLGTSFPHDAGTEALLLVTGDPVAVFADLVDQVRAAGLDPLTYHPDEDAAPSACRVADVAYPGGESEALECEAHAFGPSAYRLDLELVVSEHPEPYLSFVRITEVRDSPSSPLPGLEAEAPTPEGDSPVTPPDFPAGLPGPGDRIGAPFAPSGEEHALLDGYELLAPPMMSTCATGGFVAVVRAVDGPSDAVAAWAEHLGEESFAQVPEPEVNGARLVLSGAGAGTVTVTGSGDYVLLDRCND
ncbi:hypothetical protein [Jiangella mangrovi]|uniref:Uncharacterized protein n=1 Tax=Jiangella mangrovi TaxID=1524084 RepID=A0A7W9GL33_9ACTN|nr:hypothetical protein [Jiangella mangrovi]MBB5785867.1 hypothetical protein [Jiangella mangrovi]